MGSRTLVCLLESWGAIVAMRRSRCDELWQGASTESRVRLSLPLMSAMGRDRPALDGANRVEVPSLEGLSIMCCRTPAGMRRAKNSDGETSVPLRHDLNGRLACSQIPQFLQIFIGESNASVGPVACFVIGDGFGRSIRLSVDKDISAGG
jgi:hypothetical protein